MLTRFLATLAAAATVVSAHLGPLTAPKTNDNVKVGATVTVTWTVDQAHDMQDLAYSTDGTTWTTITTNLARTVKSYAWTVPNKASSTVRLRVCQKENMNGGTAAGCTDAHNTQFLSAGKAVTGGKVYAAITGNFTISPATSVEAAPGALAGRMAWNAAARSVEVAFELEAAERVTLQAFDTQGKLLATLLDERRAEGRHAVSVFSNALEARGPMVLRLRAGERVLQQRVEAAR